MLGWHLQSVTICNGFVSFIPRKRGTPSEAPLFFNDAHAELATAILLVIE